MTTTSRTAPVGTKLNDGYQTLIAFEVDPDVSFWEKTVQPPGVDGGDAINTATMHNTTWRTMAARSLKTLTPFKVTCAYDPLVYNQIVAMINVEGEITVHFPDTSTLDFFGFLKSFIPGDNVEGEQPEAELEIVPTNYNPNTGNEAGPTFTNNSGT